MIKYLPTEKDFDPWGRDLDAQYAWKQFGGLSTDEAYNKFCENPEVHQEDFMFMGPNAFLYYFSVIEKYLSEVDVADQYDDCVLWIIGCGIKSQLKKNPNVLKSRIDSLTTMVIERFGNSRMNNQDKRRSIKKWKEIRVITKS